MKKYVAGILIVLALGVLCLAQAAKEPFDLKKSQAELEIMKGILSTTAKYIAQNYQKNVSGWSFSNISAYYLVGQGAVFVIPTSGLNTFSPLIISPLDQAVANPLDIDTDGILIQTGENFGQLEENLGQMDENMKQLEENKRQMEDYRLQMEDYRAALKAAEKGAVAPVPPAAPAPPAPPAPPTPPAPPQINREELRKKVETLQENINRSRAKAEANREKFKQSLKEIRMYLIEALANYGDSMTTVKPDEYFNLVFVTDPYSGYYGGSSRRYDVISIQKSWVTDYKAGRLTMDAFKQKALQYTE